MLTAADIIRMLDLKPHPEGGHYRETFRDVSVPFPPPLAGDSRIGDARSISTAIYFLLARGERSHWHRVDAVEIWHWHAGAPLALSISAEGSREDLVLGPDIGVGQRPQGIVPQGAWQSATSLGGWSLVGCTVAPGFAFDGFELAPEG